jgi:fructokinase
LGADGTWYKAGSRTGQVPSPHVVVVETTGSGDAFTAALLDSLIARRFDLGSIGDDELREIMLRACAAGALTATGYGAIPSLPGAKEIDALLRMMRNNAPAVE